LSTAKEFVNEGVYVFITGRRDQELARAVKEIGRNVPGYKKTSQSFLILIASSRETSLDPAMVTPRTILFSFAIPEEAERKAMLFAINWIDNGKTPL